MGCVMDLGFTDSVKEAFHFLEQEYGFRCTETSPWLVSYESADVFVRVVFDGTRSYELSCSIGRNDNFYGSRDVPHDLGEVVRSKGVASQDAHAAFQVTTSESLKKFVAVLAGLLKQHGQDLLTGDDTAFTKVSAFRDADCAEYAVQAELAQMRSLLEAAWREKDYTRVVELLSPLDEKLSGSERKKLNFARRRLI